MNSPNRESKDSSQIIYPGLGGHVTRDLLEFRCDLGLESGGLDSGGGSEEPPSTDGSEEPPSTDGSEDEPSDGESSEGSFDACESTWIWSCGWELQGSDCEDAGDPPSSSGSYDGEVVTVSA